MMRYENKIHLTASILIAGSALLQCSTARSQPQPSGLLCLGSAPCTCPAMNDRIRGTTARIFAGGPPGQDNVVVEDAVNGDVYRHVNQAWQRIGGSARTYALRTNVYRLAGDGHAEIAINDADNWQRFGATVVGSDIFASLGNLYMVRPANGSLPTVLYRWDGATPVVVDMVAAVSGQATYAGSDSGIYKRVSGAIYKYNAAPNNWTQIGSDAGVTDLYPAANTIFIKSGNRVWRYLNTPFR